MEILNFINNVILILVLIYSVYFGLSGIIGVLLSSNFSFKTTSKRAHFAILVAARNEAQVIEHLIDSLKAQNYDKDKYDIYVIPNNCTDNTYEVAKNAGARIIECNEKTKTKGDVLKIAFNELKDNSEIDAYIIFDADNVVHPDFLARMNECYQSGYRVAEGFRDAKNPNDSWISGSYALFYLMQNVMFNQSRMGLGANATVNGTGFMVKKEIIDTYGFETYTLTEDVEFTGICSLRGEKIAFVEDAITYDEYPVNFGPSWKQRRRWTSGNLECTRRYFFKLIGNFFKTFKLSNLDIALMYCGAIFQVLTLITTILTYLINPFSIDSSLVLGNIIYPLTFGYLASVSFDLIIVLYKGKKVKDLWKGILTFPFFLFTWIFINIACFIKKQTKWDEIKHSRVVKIDELVEKK